MLIDTSSVNTYINHWCELRHSEAAIIKIYEDMVDNPEIYFADKTGTYIYRPVFNEFDLFFRYREKARNFITYDIGEGELKRRRYFKKVILDFDAHYRLEYLDKVSIRKTIKTHVEKKSSEYERALSEYHEYAGSYDERLRKFNNRNRYTGNNMLLNALVNTPPRMPVLPKEPPPEELRNKAQKLIIGLLESWQNIFIKDFKTFLKAETEFEEYLNLDGKLTFEDLISTLRNVEGLELLDEKNHWLKGKPLFQHFLQWLYRENLIIKDRVLVNKSAFVRACVSVFGNDVNEDTPSRVSSFLDDGKVFKVKASEASELENSLRQAFFG